MRRRELLIAAAAALLPANRSEAAPAKAVTVFKDPACGCCDGWVAHMRQAGYRVTVASGDVYAAKDRLGVPQDLASCHTATVDGYVLEGHVPADAVRRLLAQRPAATGLAVPGMPIGSPGMEGGAPETYDVVVFSPRSRATFGRYRETRAV